MTDKEKLNYMRIASAIIGYDLKEKDLDTVLSIHDLILRKKGKAGLKDIVKIEHEIEKKYSQPKPIILEQLKFEVYPEDLGKHSWEDAKKVCEDLGDGWRLPTREELLLMYLNKNEIGGFVDASYWSSSEKDNEIAWFQNFLSGNQYSNYKYVTNYVRAVRSINQDNAGV